MISCKTQLRVIKTNKLQYRYRRYIRLSKFLIVYRHCGVKKNTGRYELDFDIHPCVNYRQ